MEKSILNLVGAQELTKNEQKSVNGGIKCANGFWSVCGYCTEDGLCEEDNSSNNAQ